MTKRLNQQYKLTAWSSDINNVYWKRSQTTQDPRSVLRPSNSSSRVSRSPHALIGATRLIAARHVVLALKARCHAVEVLLACSIPLFLIEFVTAWSWYGHFSKSLFSLNLWLVVYQLSVLHRHLSVNVPPQGNATGFWDWSQVFGDRTCWVPGLYRTLSQ